MRIRRRRSMRLDLRSFQLQKRAGLILVVMAVIAALVAFGSVFYVDAIASSYLEVSGNSIPNLAALEKLLKSTGKPVAVMFESPTCPICKKMYPHWARLERASKNLPIEFYHIMYSVQSASAFEKYGVTDTPTFIVFVNGKPAARHVGGFEADNVTEAMLSWALGVVGISVVSDPKMLAEEGLRVFNNKCSVCHGRIASLDEKTLRSWLESRSAINDVLAQVLRESIEENKTIEDYYGGYSALMDAVASMRRFVDLTSYEVDRASYLLSYISHVLLGINPPKYNVSSLKLVETSVPGKYTPLNSSGGGPATASLLVSSLAAFVAGVAAAFSPCVLPLLVTNIAAATASRKAIGVAGCGICGLSSYIGVLSIGLLLAILGSLAAMFQKILLPVVAFVVMAAGATSILGVPVELNAMFSARRGGLAGFCAAYGILSVQCSLPLVVGSLLLAASVGDLVSGFIVASSFALGVSLPLVVSIYAVSRIGEGFVERILSRKRVLDLVGGGVLLVSGIYLLAYSIGLI